jgi:large subunit ribosomal protein L22
VIARAKLKYLGASAQKTRLVVDLVRGRNAGLSLSILRNTPKMVAKDLEKLLKSAVANAQQKDPKLDVDLLVVSKATVDEAPVVKRARARSMGRIYRILKKACHVTIELDLQGPAAKRPAAAGARR